MLKSFLCLAFLLPVSIMSFFFTVILLESPAIDNFFPLVIKLSKKFEWLNQLRLSIEHSVIHLFYMRDSENIFRLKDKKIITFFVHGLFTLVTSVTVLFLTYLSCTVLRRRLRRAMPATLTLSFSTFSVLIVSYILKVDSSYLLRFTIITNMFVILRLYLAIFRRNCLSLFIDMIVVFCMFLMVSRGILKESVVDMRMFKKIMKFIEL